ncbi:MAG TPA: tetratricopeptide repeat protein [Thermoanaerobaculia bacterium]|nr:tetratricopeptide repeat protein [Thermoanaerobaculia bacterium]
MNIVEGRLGSRAAIALALLALLPFLNGLRAEFTFDDKTIVRDNPRISSPGRAGEIFTSHYFGGPLSTAKNYRPVVLLTYALQRWTTGTDPLPFHVVNIALHVGTTLLFAAWTLALGMPRGPSLVAAALFAVVPIHAEAVTGIVGRAELLVASLIFLSALLFRRATDGPRLRAWPYAGALVAFLLAVFTKENAVVLPGVVVLGELLRRDTEEPLGPRLRRKTLALSGLLVPVAALAAVRLFAMGGLVSKKEAFFDLDNPLAPLPHLLRAANGLWLLLRYVANTFVPLGLVADHSAHALDLVASLSDPRAGAGLAFVLALAAAGLAALRRQPIVSLGIAFFLGTILPTSNVFFPIGTIYADRLAYLPSAGLLAAAAGLAAAFPAFSAGFRTAVLWVVLAAYAGATVARNEVFRDDERLFDEMVEKVPRSARAWYNVASVAGGRGETVAARASLEKAVALFPRYYDAWAFLARMARKEARWNDARALYRRALALKPDYEIGWQGLARAEEESGRLAEAEQACVEGLRHLPHSVPLLLHRAEFLHTLSRLEEARAAWREALTADGGSARAHTGLARTLSALGRESEAVSQARWALAAAPGWRDARLFLAERYEVRGNVVAAAAELGRAVRGAPRDPKPARLLLELGAREAMARGVVSTVLPGIEKRFGNPARNLEVRAAIESYRAAARS